MSLSKSLKELRATHPLSKSRTGKYRRQCVYALVPCVPPVDGSHSVDHLRGDLLVSRGDAEKIASMYAGDCFSCCDFVLLCKLLMNRHAKVR